AILHGLVGTAGRRDPARGKPRLPAKCPATYVSIGPQGALLDRIAPARIPPRAAGPPPSGPAAPPALRAAPPPPTPAPPPPRLPMSRAPAPLLTLDLAQAHPKARDAGADACELSLDLGRSRTPVVPGAVAWSWGGRDWPYPGKLRDRTLCWFDGQDWEPVSRYAGSLIKL